MSRRPNQFGLRLGDTADGAFLAVQIQIPANLRATFSPDLVPNVVGKKVRIVSKRGMYTAILGLREVQSIVVAP